MKKFLAPTQFILGSFIVLIAAAWMAINLGLLTGFPKGVDAYAHLFRIRYILEYFPQLSLNPLWNSGTPYWLWSYPPFSSLPPSALVAFLGLAPEMAMTYVAAFHLILFFVGLFFVSWVLGKNFWFAIGLATLAALTPATWSWWGHGGNYVRLFGMGWWIWALALFFLHLKKGGRFFYGFYTLVAVLAFGTHFIFVNLLGLLIGLVIVFAISGIKEKIRAGFIYLGVPFLLTSYWLIPMLLTSGGKSRFVQGAFAKPLEFRHFINLDPNFPYFTLTFLFTGVILIALLVGISRILKPRLEKLHKGIILGLGLVSFVQIGYLLVGNIPNWPEKGYLAVITPGVSLPIIIVHGFLFTATALGRGWRGKIGNFINPALALILVLVSFSYIKPLVPSLQKGLYDVSREGQHQPEAMEVISRAELSPNYRFGTDSAFVSDWFNYVYPNISQTRDYIYQGIPYKNWQFFQEATIWAAPDRYDETEWLLDWYAIEYFSVGKASENTQFDKFIQREDLFENIADIPFFYLFRYKKAKSILSVPKAPVLLIVSEEEEYETLVRLLALGGLGSDRVLPVWGGKDLRGITLDQMKSFDGLILYNYQADSEAIKRLAFYIRDGGKVFIEENLGEEDEKSFSEPFPFRRIAEDEREIWNLSGELVDEKEAENFAPADFEGSPWKINIATEIYDWGKPILFSKGEPVIIEGSLGGGKIIWSGINLPYHALSFRNEIEAYVFEKILTRLFNDFKKEKELEKISWDKWSPQKRTLTTRVNGKGILIKESWFPNWKANILVNGRKEQLKIYKAGPNLMYIPLNLRAEEYELNIYYTHRVVEIFGWVLSGTTLVLLLIYLKKGKIPFLSSTRTRLMNKVSGWWDKDEEY